LRTASNRKELVNIQFLEKESAGHWRDQLRTYGAQNIQKTVERQEEKEEVKEKQEPETEEGEVDEEENGTSKEWSG